MRVELLISTDGLGCEAKIRSIQEDEFSSICVGSFIIWYNPNCDVILSTEIPSEVLLSLSYQWLSLALKSLRTTRKNGFFFENKPRVTTKLSEMLQNHLETDVVIWKCKKTTKFVAYYEIKSNEFFYQMDISDF